MVILRKRARTLETPSNSSNHRISDNGESQTQTNETHKVSGYEQSREERIRENRERMQKLGIVDLSLKLNSLSSAQKRSHFNRRTPQRLSPLPGPSGPPRRSSRLQNTTPVSYSEAPLAKKDKSLDGEADLIGEGSRPEVYTEEHEKLLGSTEMSWTLFVDGYDKDGRRIYDQVIGKTCHQCRQKTLGHHTHCSKCNLVQGQFCGDCLYMRYGEHVLEAKQNPNWLCPACRGICNCSLCRQAKGWPPTGSLYRKISQLGFKSVAHYLIQTHRAQTIPGKIPGTNLPVSAKRSLPFSDMEAMSKEKESPEPKDNHQGLVNPNEDNKTDDEFKSKEEEIQFPKSEYGDCNTAIETSSVPKKKPTPATVPEFEDNKTDNKSKDKHQGLVNPNEDNKTDDEFKSKEEEIQFPKSEYGDCNTAIETSSEPKNKLAPATEPEFKDNKTDNASKGDKDEKMHFLDDEHGVNNVAQSALATEPEIEDNKHKSKGYKEEKMHFLDYEHGDNSVAQRSIPKSKKPVVTREPVPDSIAGRLRQRRKSNGLDKGLIGMNEDTLVVKQIVIDLSSENEAEPNMNHSSSTSSCVDSISG
ncbi:uncharacterized protein LOC132267581 [Cornus florida]|uniref:uncharacterized protein LOC132267581 n=1 Tax=Cornus florida TaxID=4283 RepID=UPI00289EC2AB|nr:uncharacterized protein LOC132267581 [Cornus florida]